MAAGALGGSIVWPSQEWALSILSGAQRRWWERHGFLVLQGALPPSLTAPAAAAIRRFVGADDSQPGTWYSNTLDIYTDRTPSGKRPHHGPSGMVQLFHHASLWALRQSKVVHGAFADLYGTPRLFVTADRAHFKPPQRHDFPAWSNPGDVHVGLHWDVDTRRRAWPVPYVIQGVIYLENTTAAQGALRVVPGFHRRLAQWERSQPENRSAERPSGAAAHALLSEAISLEGGAGSLVLWHSALPHGPAANLARSPRVSAYLAMLPVDAAPFLGGRPADTPLSMVDAGTLSYLEGTAEVEGLSSSPHDFHALTPERSGASAESDGGGVGLELSSDFGECDGRHPVSSQCTRGERFSSVPEGSSQIEKGSVTKRVRRQSRAERAMRYFHRLPLLDEDPLESELPRLPPDEQNSELAHLTPLGQRLTGLVEWEEDGIIKQEN